MNSGFVAFGFSRGSGPVLLKKSLFFVIFRGGGGVQTPCPPLWIRPWNVAAGVFLNIYNKDRERERQRDRERERERQRERERERDTERESTTKMLSMPPGLSDKILEKIIPAIFLYTQ